MNPNPSPQRRRPAGAGEAGADAAPAAESLVDEYLELLMASLTGTVHQEVYVRRPARSHARSLRRSAQDRLAALLRARGWELVQRCPREHLVEGRAWPLVGETMVGLARLRNLRSCLEAVVRDRIPGDVIEAGTWRGGASIFMRGVLRALGDDHRTVWVADSFRGLPEPDERYPADAGDEHHRQPELAVSLAQVRDNFRRYGLLDERVRFLEGWFSETLPTVAGERWSLIRLDGDMYESTAVALENLYPQLAAGGFVVIDDGALAPCRAAVDDFRERHGIAEPITPIDWTGFYWQRAGD